MTKIYQGALGNMDKANKVLPPNLDIDSYFPTEDSENYWEMASTWLRRNGEILCSSFHWKIHGQILANGKQAWLLGDNNPMMLAISKDEDGIQHHADLQPDGRSEIFSPPWTSVTNKAPFRQKRGIPYILTEADGKQVACYLETQVVGYETIQVKAGIFQNCLRVDTDYQRSSGQIYRSATHFCAGVGLVRYKFRQIDPKINSVIVVGILELERGKVNGIEYGEPA